MHRFFISWLTALLMSAPFCLAAEVSFESLLKEMTDRTSITYFPSPEYRCLQASSYDRASIAPDKPGWFNNGDATKFLRTETNGGRQEKVLMDAQGPGTLTRWWITANHYVATFRVYLDGATEPVIVANIADLVGGNALVEGPLSAVKAAGRNLYLPIPYAKSCKITVDDMANQGTLYYQINYRSYGKGTQVESFSMEKLKEHKQLLDDVRKELNAPSRSVKRNFSESTTIDRNSVQTARYQFDKPHYVKSSILKIKADDMPQALRSTLIRVRCDGQETICCPISDFFGSGVGVNPYKSWYTSVDRDGTMVSQWPIPFRSDLTVSFENLSDLDLEASFDMDIRPYDWTDRSMYFHCNWRQDREIETVAATGTKDWNYISIDGKGVFVGDSLSVLNRHPGWWGEGDEKIYIDGETFPSHFGTGTEDYYGYAWCTAAFFESPFHAQPRAEGPQNYGNTTNSRYRLLDGIPFEKSFHFDMEVWHWHDTKIDYAVACYWYSLGNAKTNQPNNVVEEAKAKVKYQTEYVIDIPGFELVEQPKGRLSVQTLDPFGKGWANGNRHIWWIPERVGNELRLKVRTDHSGKQKISASFTKAPDYGIVQLSLNGKNLGQPIDFYGTRVAPSGTIDLGVLDLEAGEYELKVTLEGKSEKSHGYMFGIDRFEFSPTQPQRDARND